MNLFETLKQFKNIEADPGFVERSRRTVSAFPQNEERGTRHVFGRVFEGAGSLILAGILVFAVIGGFSGSKYLTPVSFSSIDPVGLRAEADAIDMQINLTNLNYVQSAGNPESTALAAVQGSPSILHSLAIPLVGAPGTTASTSATSTATSTSMSINEALQKLAQ